MKYKRILICDDMIPQAKVLQENLNQWGYKSFITNHYRNVLEEVDSHYPIHLLILDLGYDGKYDGWQCINGLIEKHPEVKFIFRSDIVTKDSLQEEASRVRNEVSGYKQFKGFLSPSATPIEIRLKVDEVLGTSKWIEDDGFWMLHISDPQFGDKGLDLNPTSMAHSINQVIKTFIATPVKDEPSQRRYPQVALLTGDLTQSGRPCEFAQVTEFAKCLSRFMAENRSSSVGLIDTHNIIPIPGNHDINWDILHAQNIKANWSKTDKKRVYETVEKREELKFIHEYGWKPYMAMGLGLSESEENWIWQPGYRLIPLIKELGIIFVCLNSSRWGVDHVAQKASIPRQTLEEIESELKKIDPETKCLRILLVHHTLDRDAINQEDKLSVEGAGNIVDLLSRSCRFSIVLTGHTHKSAAWDANPDNSDQPLFHVGAGTLRSDDTAKHIPPSFNLLAIRDRDQFSDKFKRLVVYSFVWDGKNEAFKLDQAFKNNTMVFKDCVLKY